MSVPLPNFLASLRQQVNGAIAAGRQAFDQKSLQKRYDFLLQEFKNLVETNPTAIAGLLINWKAKRTSEARTLVTALPLLERAIILDQLYNDDIETLLDTDPDQLPLATLVSILEEALFTLYQPTQEEEQEARAILETLPRRIQERAALGSSSLILYPLNKTDWRSTHRDCTANDLVGTAAVLYKYCQAAGLQVFAGQVLTNNGFLEGQMIVYW